MLVWLTNKAYAGTHSKYRSKGNVIGVFNGRQPAVLVMKPELIKDVLIKNFKQFQDNEFADSVSKDSDPIFGRNPFMLKEKCTLSPTNGQVYISH